MSPTSGTSTLPPPSAPPTTPPAPPRVPTPTPPPRPTPPRRERTAAHVVAIVIGGLLLLPGLGLLAGGSAAVAGQAWATDDGFFEASLDRVGSDGSAVATSDLWLDGHVEGTHDGPTWLLDVLDVEMRLGVVGAGPTDEVFVGIARSADVDRYLADVDHSRVVEIDHRTPRYVEMAGPDAADPPVDQDFWAVSASGGGEQELTWEARGGSWSVVVMNADGTAGVGADIDVGFRSGAITPIAVTMIVVGGLVIATAVVLIVVGVRGRRSVDTGPSATNRPGGRPAT